MNNGLVLVIVLVVIITILLSALLPIFIIDKFIIPRLSYEVGKGKAKKMEF